jgi:hypothetical protein
MITHNGTYLGAATHHGMPIVAATMGGKMVIGWLQSATLQAIVAAFGAEGTEVIRKTNDYLNRIALTDPQRALLLAGFINEDPMLVCSLVETSKMRWLKTDGKAWMDTGFVANEGMHAFITAIPVAATPTFYFGSHNDAIEGTTNNYNRNMLQLDGVSNTATFNILNMGRGNTISGKLKIGKENEIEVSSNQKFFVVNGTRSNITGILGTIQPINNVVLFISEYSGNISASGSACGKIIIYDENEMLMREMYPMQRTDGTCGMLDIISGTFHPNANTEGSFTIQITDKA